MQICTTAGGSESLKIAQPTFTPQSSQHGVFQYNPSMVLLKTHKQKAGGAARAFPMQLREPARRALACSLKFGRPEAYLSMMR